jgi:hypothetical protein
LFHVEASLVMISQFGLKTYEGETVGDAHGTIAEIASEAN